MRKIAHLFFLLIMVSCYVPNSGNSPLLSYEFEGDVTRLEDVFLNSNYEFTEVDYRRRNERNPTYQMSFKMGDTIAKYTFSFFDCHNYSAHFNWGHELECSYSGLRIDDVSYNVDSIPELRIERMFKEHFLNDLSSKLKEYPVEYEREIIRSPSSDSIVIEVRNQENVLRKKLIFFNDTIKEDVNHLATYNYYDDLMVEYLKNPDQHYIYLLSKTNKISDTDK